VTLPDLGTSLHALIGIGTTDTMMLQVLVGGERLPLYQLYGTQEYGSVQPHLLLVLLVHG